MGYWIEVNKVYFRLKAEKIPETIKAIKSLHGKEPISDSSGSHFSWVDNQFYKLNTIQELMAEFRWKPTTGENGDLIDLEFTGQKLGDDEEFFDVIAPFVESGSYIEVEGEDNDKWRWVFKDGKMIRVTPKIFWPQFADIQSLENHLTEEKK
jgi:hypothetical protein